LLPLGKQSRIYDVYKHWILLSRITVFPTSLLLTAHKLPKTLCGSHAPQKTEMKLLSRRKRKAVGSQTTSKDKRAPFGS